jgi:superfamily I DNA/RNA helicase/RecB family exonuclease
VPREAAPPPVLDESQRRVVEHRGGPLLVLAGPGTGKTTTLVETVVARVAAGVPVERILMLTFSRRAAGEMRERVAARLNRIVREPVARTLHSYAYGVLRMDAAARELPTPRLLSGPEQDLMIRQLVEEGGGQRWPAALRPALRTQAFAGELRALLMRAVERGLDGPALAALGTARGRPDWTAAGEFLTEYQDVTALANPGGYDPAELIRSATDTFRADPALLALERDRRRHIFVDEYQDTDPAQAELLALLCGGAEELVLVGDPDQSIYAFRGADPAAMREVDDRYGGGRPVPTVALTTCRRSGPVLLAGSRRIAERLPGPVEQRRLNPAAGIDPGTIEVGLFRSGSEEAAFVAGELRRAHLDGMPWRDMAVLVRTTSRALGVLRRAMITAGVPVTVRGEDLPLAEQSAVGLLLDLMEYSADPNRLTPDAAERLLLGPVGGADSVYLRRLKRELARQARVAGAEVGVRDVLLDTAGRTIHDDSLVRPIRRVGTVLAAGQAAARSGVSPEELLWAVWEATGLASRWERQSALGGAAGQAADRDLDAVVALFDAAARFTDRLPGARAERFTEHLRAQQIPGDTLAPRAARTDAVTILTAHASKGLEWELVCIANVQEGVWPDVRRRGSLLGTDALVDVLAGVDPRLASSSAPRLAEERRLFYVAATRARKRLVATAVLDDEEQPSRFLDELDPTDGDRELAAPQRGIHLSGLVAELRTVVTDDRAEQADREAAATQLARLADAGVPAAGPEQWWGLAGLSDDRPLYEPGTAVAVSPSRIERFLRCELQSVLLDLGVRDGDQVSASLGTLIHDLAADAPPGTTAAEFEEMLEARWSTLNFAAPWFAANERERAAEIVGRLADWLVTSRAHLDLVDTELGFTTQVGDAVLSGRVDRLERDADGRLVVIDLKTGKSKPREADMPRHPQLAAYQFAVTHGAFGEHGDRSGGAALVQLASTGRSGAEQPQAPLSDEDAAWMAETVARIAGRMQGTEFTAVAATDCNRCEARLCCPIQTEGKQVTA